MTDATIAEHHRRPLLKVIRAKCLDCCCGDRVEVKHCTVIHCDLHPYRMGKNPFFSRTPKDKDMIKENLYSICRNIWYHVRDHTQRWSGLIHGAFLNKNACYDTTFWNIGWCFLFATIMLLLMQRGVL